MPFAGTTGQLLDNMLRAVQLSRDGAGAAGARLTPVVKCRPAAVRNPTPDELARCAVYLQREIALTQPKVIVAMGRFAALSLLGRDYPQLLQLPFGQVRGKVYRYMGIAVVVTYHPSKLLRVPLQKAHVWADLCLARAQAVSPPTSSSSSSSSSVPS
jgi:DNA polymerase